MRAAQARYGKEQQAVQLYARICRALRMGAAGLKDVLEKHLGHDAWIDPFRVVAAAVYRSGPTVELHLWLMGGHKAELLIPVEGNPILTIRTPSCECYCNEGA